MPGRYGSPRSLASCPVTRKPMLAQVQLVTGWRRWLRSLLERSAYLGRDVPVVRVLFVVGLVAAVQDEGCVAPLTRRRSVAGRP